MHRDEVFGLIEGSGLLPIPSREISEILDILVYLGMQTVQNLIVFLLPSNFSPPVEEVKREHLIVVTIINML